MTVALENKKTDKLGYIAPVTFLLAGLMPEYVAPFFTADVIAEVTCVGSVIIIALGLNLLGLTKIKCANFLPAIFLPILFCMFL